MIERLKDKYKDKEIVLFLIIPILLMAFMFGINKIYDTDFFWHLKTGEWVWTHKAVPTHDIFSWLRFDTNMEWFAHEWLSEVIFYLIYQGVGYIGLILLPAFICLFIVYFLYTTNKEYFKRNIILFFLWIGLFLYQIQSFTVARPQVFSYVFLTITIYILTKYRTQETKLIWLLPIISVLWVNMHGGSFSVLYVLIIITMLSGIFNFKFQRIRGYKLPKIKLIKLSSVFILTILASMINQMGYKILLYPFQLTGNDVLMNTIAEWTAPDIKSRTGLLVFVALGIVITTLLVLKSEIDLYDMLLVLGFTYLTLKSIRFIPLFLIVSTPILFKYIPKINFNHLSGFSRLRKIIGLSIIVFSIYLISNISVLLTLCYQSPIGYNLFTYPSDKAIEYIKKEEPKRLFNHYNWGGYLISKDIPVFMDGRSDMYIYYNYEDYLKIANVKPGIKDLLKKYDFDMIITTKASSLPPYIDNDTDYTKVFEDDTCFIYKKVTR